MLNPFNALFNPENPRHDQSAALWMVSLPIIVLALNAAGQVHTGLLGLVGLTLLFMLLGWAGCYWYAASIHLLAQFMGVESRRSQPWLTSLQGLWPLIFLGPAVSAQRGWPSFGLLFTLIVLGSTLSTLLFALKRAYSISWLQAGLFVGATAFLGSLALLGLIGWPTMLVLGTKNFSMIPIP
jgi:hypothetical protein